MSQIVSHRFLATIALLASAAISVHAQAPAAPDSTLYTTYTLFAGSGGVTVSWSVCGSTAGSSGCYASGSLGPFVAVGAMVEGKPSVSGNVVTRAIYVVDSGNASVKLYVYKKTDTVSSSFDTVAVTLLRTATLPLTGGSSAQTFMAANSGFLFVGTDLTSSAVEVKKSNLAVTTIPGFSPPINVSSITSDEYGYVTVTFGGSSESGFYLYGPAGTLQEDGGGLDFVLGTTQAISLTNLGSPVAQPSRRLGYELKAATAAKEQ